MKTSVDSGRGVKTSLGLGSAHKNKPHLRWATRGLIKRSEPMKTRSYIRYLFHSYTHTHRLGYNSAIVPKGVKRVIIIIHKRRPGLADQRHGNRKDREEEDEMERMNSRVSARRVSRRKRVERIEISLSVALLAVLRGDLRGERGLVDLA